MAARLSKSSARRLSAAVRRVESLPSRAPRSDPNPHAFQRLFAWAKTNDDWDAGAFAAETTCDCTVWNRGEATSEEITAYCNQPLPEDPLPSGSEVLLIYVDGRWYYAGGGECE